MLGVKLGRRAHQYSSGGVTLANQWPAACLHHTKVLAQLSWNLDGGETKKDKAGRVEES